MKKPFLQLTALSMVAAMTFTNLDIVAYASTNKVTSVLPQAGFTYALGNNQVSLFRRLLRLRRLSQKMLLQTSASLQQRLQIQMRQLPM